MKYDKAIKTIRAIKGISQKELSSILLVNPSYISLIEKGSRTPSIEVLEKISTQLSIPMHLIMLLASEKDDLKEVPYKEARILADNLLHLLLSPHDGKKRKAAITS